MELLPGPWADHHQRAQPGTVRSDRVGGLRSTPRCPCVPLLGLHQLAAVDLSVDGGAVRGVVLRAAVPTAGAGLRGAGCRYHAAASGSGDGGIDAFCRTAL